MWRRVSANRLNWSQGHEGKGNVYDDGSISTWNIDEVSEPHHQEVAQQEGEYQPVFLFYITNDGGVNDGGLSFNNLTAKPDTTIIAEICAQDPSLYDASDEEVDLNTETTPRQDDYSHAQDLLDMVSKVAGMGAMHSEFKIPRHIRRDIRRWADRLDWPEGSEKDDARKYHITILTFEEYCEDFIKFMSNEIKGREFNFKSTGMELFENGFVVLRLECPEWEELAVRWGELATNRELEPHRFPGGPKCHITIGNVPEQQWPQGVPDPHVEFSTKMFNVNINKKSDAPRYQPGQEMPTGLPRPVAPLNGTPRPVPWSQDSQLEGGEVPWAQTHDDNRVDVARYNSLCLLCGDPVDNGVVICRNNPRYPMLPKYTFDHLREGEGNIVDNAPLHERCGKITMAHCPHLNNDTHQLAPYSSEGFDDFADGFEFESSAKPQAPLSDQELIELAKAYVPTETLASHNGSTGKEDGARTPRYQSSFSDSASDDAPTDIAGELAAWLKSIPGENQTVLPIHHRSEDDISPQPRPPASYGPHIDPPSHPFKPFDQFAEGVTSRQAAGEDEPGPMWPEWETTNWRTEQEVMPQLQAAYQDAIEEIGMGIRIDDVEESFEQAMKAYQVAPDVIDKYLTRMRQEAMDATPYQWGRDDRQMQIEEGGQKVYPWFNDANPNQNFVMPQGWERTQAEEEALIWQQMNSLLDAVRRGRDSNVALGMFESFLKGYKIPIDRSQEATAHFKQLLQQVMDQEPSYQEGQPFTVPNEWTAALRRIASIVLGNCETCGIDHPPDTTCPDDYAAAKRHWYDSVWSEPGSPTEFPHQPQHWRQDSAPDVNQAQGH